SRRADKCAARESAGRSGIESALQRPRRNAVAGLAGRDQGLPRLRGSAAAAGAEGGRHQAGVTFLFTSPRKRGEVTFNVKGKPMPAEINIYNPEALGPPMGQYTHVTRVKANEFLFIAGMLSGDAAGNVIGDGDFDVQTGQVFRNVEAALKSAGASWA